MTDVTDVDAVSDVTEAAAAAEPVRQRLVTWQDPALTAAGMVGRSGVEFLRAIASGELPQPPISHLVGMGIESVEEGRVVFTLDTGEHQYNPIGSIHGGIFATILDSVLGCAVHSSQPAGRGYTTLELKVSYIRPLTTAVRRVKAVGEVISAGRRVATAEGRIVDDEGRLYAHATTTCLLFDVPA